MNPEIIENYELWVVGIEMPTSATRIAADMQRQNDQADQLDLGTAIRHRVDPDVYLSVLWHWHPDGEFPLMCAAEVASDEDVPRGCVVRRFPACDFAVFPMAGKMPNLVEPWPDIGAWYPNGVIGNTTTIRRYNERTRTGEVLIPWNLTCGQNPIGDTACGAGRSWAPVPRAGSGMTWTMIAPDFLRRWAHD